MAELDAENIAAQMIAAAKGVIAGKWPEIEDLASSEFKKIAESIKTIAVMRAKGTFDEEDARLHLEFQRSASRAVMAGIEGMTAAMAQQAINAGLAVVRQAVNTAVGFVLL